MKIKLSDMERDCEGLIRQSTKDHVFIGPDDFDQIVHEIGHSYAKVLGECASKGILDPKEAETMGKLIGLAFGEMYHKIFHEEEDK